MTLKQSLALSSLPFFRVHGRLCTSALLMSSTVQAKDSDAASSRSTNATGTKI